MNKVCSWQKAIRSYEFISDSKEPSSTTVSLTDRTATTGKYIVIVTWNIDIGKKLAYFGLKILQNHLSHFSRNFYSTL